MILYLMLLRLRQLWRYMKEMGAFRSIFLLLALLIFVPRLGMELWLNNPYYPAFFWVFILLSIHVRRSDQAFLKQLTSQSNLLFIAEYGIITLPLAIFYIFWPQWLATVGLGVAVVIVPFIPQFSLSLSSKSATPWWELKTLFSPLYFEWVSGFRQRLYSIGILWLLGMVFCAFAPVVPIISFLLSIVITQFYQLCEPKEMMEVYKLSGRGLVQWKMRQGWRLFALLTLPHWIGFMIFNYQYWFAWPLVWFMAGQLLTLAVLFKYAAYIPNEDLSQNNTLMTLAIMFMFLQPFSFLINLFWIIRYYGRALRNMSDYLDDG